MENLKPITWDYELVKNSSLVTDAVPIVEKYFEKVKAVSFFGTNQNKKQNVTFCYTAMHGVGLEFAKKAFQVFGLSPFKAVPSQAKPDPEFPTVTFPNPEEKGALNHAIRYANDEGCQIILANDPDADRLAIAVDEPAEFMKELVAEYNYKLNSPPEPEY